MPAGIRERLAELFDCPVQSWYSNEENGIMGIQPRDGDSYYIDTANYYYEILKLDSDEPAAPGELGRIVITDLNNRAMPMLRYDNGDLASYELTDYGTRYRLVLKELYGRRSDIIYDTKGGALTPFVITNNLWDVEGVRQFQFIQTDVKNYTVRLNADKEKIDEADIMRRIGHYFGDDAVFTIEYVDEIPVLNSGKRKYIMNLCEKYK
jgi:phenylacetate-CoA ligase